MQTSTTTGRIPGAPVGSRTRPRGRGRAIVTATVNVDASTRRPSPVRQRGGNAGFFSRISTVASQVTQATTVLASGVVDFASRVLTKEDASVASDRELLRMVEAAAISQEKAGDIMHPEDTSQASIPAMTERWVKTRSLMNSSFCSLCSGIGNAAW